MTREELNELVEKLYEHLEEMRVFYDVYPEEDDTISVDISWGDWKHDHLWFDHDAEKFFNSLGYDVIGFNTDVYDEDGSDAYSAIHSLKLRKREEESLDNLKDKKLREDDLTDAGLHAMIDSEDDQDEAYIGPFWYDTDRQEVYGQVLTVAKDKPFYKSDDKEIRTGTALHKAIWKKEEKRNKDKRFTGDYKQKPRGRVFEVKDDGFKVFVGNWINDYPEAKEEIISVFQLPKDKTEFIIDKHWDIGHGWSEEVYLEGIRYCEEEQLNEESSLDKIKFELNDDGDTVAIAGDKSIVLGDAEIVNLPDEEKIVFIGKTLADMKKDKKMKSDYKHWVNVLGEDPFDKKESLEEEKSKREKAVDEFEETVCKHDFEFSYLDEYDVEQPGLEDHEGEHCIITSMEVDIYDEKDTFEDNFERCYWNIKFDNGDEFRGVPGRALIDLTEEDDDLYY